MVFQSSQSLCLIAVIVLTCHKLSCGQQAAVSRPNSDLLRLEQIMIEQNQAVLSLIHSLRGDISNVGSCCNSLSVQPCPPGFVYRPCVNSCYKVILESLTWDQSQARCAQEHPGAHAVVVNNAEEDRVIVEYLKSFSATATRVCHPTSINGAGFYTSGQRVIPRDCSQPFVWKTNSTTILPLTYTNWAVPQPDCYLISGFTRESCLHYIDSYQYKWNDIACEETMCAICEVDK